MIKIISIVLAVICVLVLALLIISSFLTPKRVFLYRKERIDTYDDLVQQFRDMFKTVRYQNTAELLECLIEMDELDKIYEKIQATDEKFINKIAYQILKKETLSKIINEKINSISISPKKLQKFKDLKDELEYCKERYPEYSEVFDAKLYSTEQNIKIYDSEVLQRVV